jgi:hypothetical protein
MKPPVLAGFGALSLAILAGVAVLRQQSDLSRVEREVADLNARRTAMEQSSPAPATTSDPQPTAPRGSLSQEETRELLRLRADFARLRDQQRALAGVRKEHQELQAKLATDVGANGVAGAMPSGWVRRSEARFLGTGNPDALIQSLFWAIHQRNTNAALQLFTEQGATQLRQAMAQEGPGGFWDEATNFPGFRIVAREPRSAEEIVLKVEFLPGTPPVEMVVNRVGNEWRLAP